MHRVIRSLCSALSRIVSLILYNSIGVRWCNCSRHLSIAIQSLVLSDIVPLQVRLQLDRQFYWTKICVCFPNSNLPFVIIVTTSDLWTESFNGYPTNVAVDLLARTFIQSIQLSIVGILPDCCGIEMINLLGISLRLLLHASDIEASLSEVKAICHIVNLLPSLCCKLTCEYWLSLNRSLCLLNDIELVLTKVPCSVLLLHNLDLLIPRFSFLRKDVTLLIDLF